VLKRSPPDWNDEQGVADLGAAIVAKNKAEADAFEAYGDAVADFHARESIAVAAALQGDVAPLTALLQDPEWQCLQPDTRQLMRGDHAGQAQRTRQAEADVGTAMGGE
jgi:hypothetical protein